MWFVFMKVEIPLEKWILENKKVSFLLYIILIFSNYDENMCINVDIQRSISAVSIVYLLSLDKRGSCKYKKITKKRLQTKRLKI